MGPRVGRGLHHHLAVLDAQDVKGLQRGGDRALDPMEACAAVDEQFRAVAGQSPRGTPDLQGLDRLFESTSSRLDRRKAVEVDGMRGIEASSAALARSGYPCPRAVQARVLSAALRLRAVLALFAAREAAAAAPDVVLLPESGTSRLQVGNGLFIEPLSLPSPPQGSGSGAAHGEEGEAGKTEPGLPEARGGERTEAHRRRAQGDRDLEGVCNVTLHGDRTSFVPGAGARGKSRTRSQGMPRTTINASVASVPKVSWRAKAPTTRTRLSAQKTAAASAEIRVDSAASPLAGNRALHWRPVGQSFHGDGLCEERSQHEIRKS